MKKIRSFLLLVLILCFLAACDKYGLDNEVYKEGKSYAKLMYTTYQSGDDKYFEMKKDEIFEYVTAEPKSEEEEAYKLHINGMYIVLTFFDDEDTFNDSVQALQDDYGIKFD